MYKKSFYVITFLVFLSIASYGCISITILGSITGTVSDAQSGSPIVGAAVFTTPSTEVEITNSQGKFTLSSIEEGVYTVTATASGYDSASVAVTVDHGESVKADIKLTQSQPIFSGTVRRGDDGTLLSGIKITVKTGNSQTQEYSTTTGSDGKFSFRKADIVEGEWNPYWAFVDAEGYEYQRTLVYLKEATPNATFDFRLYPNTVNASISGAVKDFLGNPITSPVSSLAPQFFVTRDISTEAGKQAVVRVDRADQVTYNISGGTYNVAKLAGGTEYTVGVIAAGYLGREAKVAFSSGSISATHDFTLRSSLNLTKPIPNERVTAPPAFEWQVVAGADRYRLRVASGPIEADQDTGAASTSGTFLWESPNTSPAAASATAGLTYGGTTQLVSGGTYYWQVFAYNASDQVIGYSPSSWKFRIK